MMPTRSDPARKTTWPAVRVARLGFLVGLGLDARGVAADPLVAASPANVHRQAKRFGLAFRAGIRPALPEAVLRRYDLAAAARGLTRDHLIRRLIVHAGSDDSLLDNILDDR